MALEQDRECQPGEVFCQTHAFQYLVDVVTGARVEVRVRIRRGFKAVEAGSPEWERIYGFDDDEIESDDPETNRKLPAGRAGPGICEKCYEEANSDEYEECDVHGRQIRDSGSGICAVCTADPEARCPVAASLTAVHADEAKKWLAGGQSDGDLPADGVPVGDGRLRPAEGEASAPGEGRADGAGAGTPGPGAGGLPARAGAGGGSASDRGEGVAAPLGPALGTHGLIGARTRPSLILSPRDRRSRPAPVARILDARGEVVAPSNAASPAAEEE